jgi:hypothetical protein
MSARPVYSRTSESPALLAALLLAILRPAMMTTGQRSCCLGLREIGRAELKARMVVRFDESWELGDLLSQNGSPVGRIPDVIHGICRKSPHCPPWRSE